MFNQLKETLVRQWGKVLFLEDIENNQLIIAHYDCFIKVDVFCYTVDSLSPSLWTKQLCLIKDTKGQVVKQLMLESADKKAELSLAELANWQTKFFAYYHEVYRRAQRGECYYALSCIDKLRQLVVMGWYYQDGLRANSFGNWAKYQGPRSQLSETQHELLTSFFVKQDLKNLATVMPGLTRAFFEIGQELEKQMDLPYSPKECWEIFQMVDFT